MKFNLSGHPFGCGLLAAAGLAALLAGGCSFAMRAELLNPLNKSGRAEKSEPVQAAAPSPAPSPSTTPEGGR